MVVEALVRVMANGSCVHVRLICLTNLFGILYRRVCAIEGCPQWYLNLVL